MSADAEPQFDIRPLERTAEFQACVELQEATWGVGFSERVPVALLRVAARMGGVVSGAFLPDGRMAGFVFGLTGLDGGQLAHWSDMLAVAREFRSSGLGWRLKMHQRDRLLASGISRAFWSFDPLVAANAHLNLAKLGAVSREYVEDMYGYSDSPLHQGIGTDRLVACWELDSERVITRLADPGVVPPFPPGARPVLEPADTPPQGSSGDAPGAILAAAPSGLPAEPVLGLDERAITIAIPRDIHAVMEGDPEAARSWRSATRVAFRHYVGRGWEVTELDRGGPFPRYLLIYRDL